MVQLIVQGFWFGLLLDLTVQRHELFYILRDRGIIFKIWQTELSIRSLFLLIDMRHHEAYAPLCL